MFDNFALLEPFNTFWFVTITPYGKEIEPHVPDKERVLDSFLRLSGLVGAGRMSWRYDPIFISGKYSVDYHIKQFEYMANACAAARISAWSASLTFTKKRNGTFLLSAQ